MFDWFNLKENPVDEHDMLWSDSDVIWWIARHDVSMSKNDYSLNQLRKIKMLAGKEKEERHERNRKKLIELLGE